MIFLSCLGMLLFLSHKTNINCSVGFVPTFTEGLGSKTAFLFSTGGKYGVSCEELKTISFTKINFVQLNV